MTFEEKHKLAVKELKKAKIWRASYFPPLVWSLNKLGYKNIPPPYYNALLNNVLLMGTPFGLFMGLFMYFVMWHSLQIAVTQVILISLIEGIFFGLCMAFYYKYVAFKHRLTPWHSISGQHQDVSINKN